jgi:hypothetical protein
MNKKKHIGAKSFFVMLSIAAVICVVGIVGCVTKNPEYKPLPADQDPVTNPQFISNAAAISNTVAMAHGINQVTAPVNPYSAPMDLAIDSVAGLVAIASAFYARLKHNKAAESARALDTMALGVVKAGPTAIAAVHETAAATPEFTTVAAAINENTP